MFLKKSREQLIKLLAKWMPIVASATLIVLGIVVATTA